MLGINTSDKKHKRGLFGALIIEDKLNLKNDFVSTDN